MSFHEGSKFQEVMERQRAQRLLEEGKNMYVGDAPTQDRAKPHKDKVLFYLTRRLRDAEDRAAVNHERMAKEGRSYQDRMEAERKSDEAKHEEEALRAAVECVREHYRP